MEKSKYIHKHIQIHVPGQRKSKEGGTQHTQHLRKKENARKHALALLRVWMILRLHSDNSCYCVCVHFLCGGVFHVHVLFSISFIHPQVHCVIDIFIYTARTRLPNNYNYMYTRHPSASPPYRLSFLLSNNYKSFK